MTCRLTAWGQTIKDNTTDVLHRGDKGPAGRAPAYMGGDPVALRFIERSGRECREIDVGGMRLGRHDICPSKARRRASASRKRDLTVPSGI